VTATGAVTITGTNPHDVKVTLKTATGVLSGSFEPTAGAKPAVKFHGILVQFPTVPQAGGYFLGPVVSGSGLSGYVAFPTIYRF